MQPSTHPISMKSRISFGMPVLLNFSPHRSPKNTWINLVWRGQTVKTWVHLLHYYLTLSLDKHDSTDKACLWPLWIHVNLFLSSDKPDFPKLSYYSLALFFYIHCKSPPHPSPPRPGKYQLDLRGLYWYRIQNLPPHRPRKPIWFHNY